MSAARARVKSGVSYSGAAGPAIAPTGEYDLSAEGGRMRLSSPATAREFRLSCDAFCRLVAEGRITLID